MVCSDEYTTARNTMWQILLQYSAGLGAPVLIELFLVKVQPCSELDMEMKCKLISEYMTKVMNILKMLCQYIVMMSKRLIDHETTSKELLQLGWTPCFEQILHWKILRISLFSQWQDFSFGIVLNIVGLTVLMNGAGNILCFIRWMFTSCS